MHTQDLLEHFHRTIDALVAIKLDLNCHHSVADNAPVITGGVARRACTEIDRTIDDIRQVAMALRSLGAD